MLLQVKNLFFSYNAQQPLFTNLNLLVNEAEIIALAGESGCGKSTLLNIIYGLIDWQKGDLIFNEKKLLGPKANIVPGEAEMKMVAQDYDLMPYATVYDNVGKYLSNINLEEKRQKVTELLQIVGMQNFIDVLPKNLSGGQQQRVAIARALSIKPKLLLLDEPFSNLDFPRKIELRENLFKYAKDKRIAIIISTHELQEVLPWLDRIIILQEGRLIQNDESEETYKHPYNEYVAKLFGEVNIFSEEETQIFNISKRFYYPHQIKISENGKAAKVLESRFSGNFYRNKVKLKNKELIIYSEKEISDEINIQFPQENTIATS